MFLELERFVSLLLSLLALAAVLPTAFLEPGAHPYQQLVPALRRLLFAAAVCIGSGLIFAAWERRAGRPAVPLVRSLPMQVFWWAGGALALLFSLSWLLERHFFHQWS